MFRTKGPKKTFSVFSVEAFVEVRDLSGIPVECGRPKIFQKKLGKDPKQTNKQLNKQTNKQTGKQTNKQTMVPQKC